MRKLATIMALLAMAGCEAAPEPVLVAGVTVAGQFGEDGEPSQDVSGLACDRPAEGEAARCLIISDEGAEAQWVEFGDGVLTAAGRFALFSSAPPSADFGTPPRGICDEENLDQREFDGEAASFNGSGTYYLVGSHGCSRDSGELRPAQFLVAEIDEATNDRRLSYRLSELLSAHPLLSGYFGASLNRTNGLNIEGVAATGNRLIFGLRAPVIDGMAYLFETTPGAIFGDRRLSPDDGAVIAVPLGADTGIRDLAALSDGRLLILSGPAQEQAVPYRIHLRSEDGALTTLETIDPPGEGKAEALAVIGVDDAAVDVLVLFDSAANGAPRLIELSLP
ncbi:MAG: DUF3616 domain-containing protein [Sphingomonadaceae bacterium]|nr:DUF3616 domain-containing protein [Sphingomonadaceae bacterium]